MILRDQLHEWYSGHPMSSVALIVNVMFAIYLFSFLSSCVAGFTEKRSAKVRFWTDLSAGVVLFVAVLVVNHWNS